jgi:hypothetical protein
VSDYPGQDVFHPSITVLPDNAQPSAMNFALAVEGLTDRTTFLANRGFGGIYTQTSYLTSGSGGDVVGATGGGGGWVEFAASAGLVPYVDVPGCAAGDVVIAWCSSSFISLGNTTSKHAEIKLYAQFNIGGSPPAAAAMAGAHALVEAVEGLTVDTPQPITIVGWKVVTTAGTCRVRLRGRNPDTPAVPAAPAVVGLQRRASDEGQHVLSLTALRLRPTASWDDA